MVDAAIEVVLVGAVPALSAQVAHAERHRVSGPRHVKRTVHIRFTDAQDARDDRYVPHLPTTEDSCPPRTHPPGLDSITYLHFLRLLRWLFLAITLFAALPLTIANYYLNTNTEYGSRTTTSAGDTAQQASNMTAEDGQQMGTALVDDMLVFTATNVVGNGLWVHIGFEWVVTGLVIFFGA